MQPFTMLLAVLLVVGAVFFIYEQRAIAPDTTEAIIEGTEGEVETVFEVSTSGEDVLNRIEVTSPTPGAAIESPLVVRGEARGYWYFEATFPLVLTDWDGLIIAEGYATAEDEWMTEEFVPFTGTLTFTKPVYGERGTLILKRANASDLPEHDAALEIPVMFK